MNPFENVPVEDRFRNNPESPYYSRYEFEFNQVTPFREPLYNRLILKLKNENEALAVYQAFPEHIHRVITLRRDLTKKYDFIKENEYYFEFYVVTDKLYIAVENIYFAVDALAGVIEDCHFFMYSADGDSRWIDEYKLTGGKLFFNRDIADGEDYTWYLDYYLSRALKQPDDVEFMRFTLYQLGNY